jgi:hypothetical protein
LHLYAIFGVAVCGPYLNIFLSLLLCIIHSVTAILGLFAGLAVFDFAFALVAATGLDYTFGWFFESLLLDVKCLKYYCFN